MSSCGSLIVSCGLTPECQFPFIPLCNQQEAEHLAIKFRNFKVFWSRTVVYFAR